MYGKFHKIYLQPTCKITNVYDITMFHFRDKLYDGSGVCSAYLEENPSTRPRQCVYSRMALSIFIICVLSVLFLCASSCLTWHRPFPVCSKWPTVILEPGGETSKQTTHRRRLYMTGDTCGEGNDRSFVIYSVSSPLSVHDDVAFVFGVLVGYNVNTSGISLFSLSMHIPIQAFS